MSAAETRAEAPVAVVTDSTTYLPPDLIRRWGIGQVSLYVGWDGDRRPEHEYDLDALGRRLPRLLRAARLSRPRHRLGPHSRGPLRHLRERARGRQGHRRA